MSNSGSGSAQHDSGVNYGMDKPRRDVPEYACPECGYDGPHAVLNTEWPPVVECGDTKCAAEFTADPGEGE